MVTDLYWLFCRIYVDLPDVENRKKILSIFLAQENLAPGFQFDKLSEATEGYSGSDLKNLCIAAAYRPVQELLEEEKKVICICYLQFQCQYLLVPFTSPSKCVSFYLYFGVPWEE